MRLIGSFLALLLPSAGTWAQSAPKLEFEVASVKSVVPDPRGWAVRCNGGPGTQDPTLFTCENISLSSLVTMAYRIDYHYVSKPDWMETTLFNLTARVPEGITREQLSTMLQNLLIERFKLAVRREPRVSDGYDLVIAKNGPKFMRAADSANKEATAGSKRSSPADDKGFPNFGPGRPGMGFGPRGGRMYFPAVTLDYVAAMVSGQVEKVVTDATGLKGKYEISLYWTPDSMRSATAGGPDDGLGPSIFQALQDQLGLRLEPNRRQVEFLLVEHADKVPSDN